MSMARAGLDCKSLLVLVMSLVACSATAAPPQTLPAAATVEENPPDREYVYEGRTIKVFDRDTGKPQPPTKISGELIRILKRDKEGRGLNGVEVRPRSNLIAAGEPEGTAHTAMRIFIPAAGEDVTPMHHLRRLELSQRLRQRGGNPANGPAVVAATGFNDNTPASLACFYKLVPQSPYGCHALNATQNPSGGRGAIAIVIAYHHPTALADLATFSNYFGLPAANASIVYATSNGAQPQPTVNEWDIEAALDLQWAHAMAPNAKLFLVEANTNSHADLYNAVVAARLLVAANGGGQVSLSWGAKEWSGQSAFNGILSMPIFLPGLPPAPLTTLACSHDTGGVVFYPASSPFVLGVGGTVVSNPFNPPIPIPSLPMLPMTETAWVGSGGGVSAYEAKPGYQSALPYARRSVPDVSLMAASSNSNAFPGGVPVYTSTTGWVLVGGTSLATPLLAGILNQQQAYYPFPGTYNLLTRLYSTGVGNNAAYFRDIKSGTCGSLSAGTGYDLCTGWGSKITYGGL
jgi:kumamolisin